MITTERTRRTRTAAPQVRILERYRLVERLAVGGSAAVWRAVDERTGREVAIKQLHPHLLPDAASRGRLLSEARAVAGLRHPGIVRVLDIDPGDDPGAQPAVVFELVRGEALSTRLARRGALAEREAAAIGAGLADALYQAHINGVIHRDVKPGNVLIGMDGAPRLVDFGIARVLGEVAERTTQTGMVMGTLRYMAPEQLAGEEITPRVDLYGLGATLHEMLTGQAPFPAHSPAGLLAAQDAGPPALPGIDSALAGVTRACLQGRPQDRPLHAGVVAAALRAWLDGDRAPAEEIGASVPSAVAAPLPSDPAASTMPVPRGVRTRPSRRRPPALGRVAAAAGLLALVVAGAGLAIGAGRFVAGAGTASSAPPSARPLPPWAATLAATYRDGCATSGPTAADLAAMDEATAQRYVEALVAACATPSPVPTPAPPRGGGGHGHGHGKD